MRGEKLEAGDGVNHTFSQILSGGRYHLAGGCQAAIRVGPEQT